MSVTELPLGVVIPDSADELIQLWSNEENLTLVCLHKRRRRTDEVARTPLKLRGPLPRAIGDTVRGVATIAPTRKIHINDWFVDGLPPNTGPWVYSSLQGGPHTLYPGDSLVLTITLVARH